LTVPDEGYPRKASCALYLISTFLLAWPIRKLRMTLYQK